MATKKTKQTALPIPIQNRVIIEREDEIRMSPGGIFIPDSVDIENTIEKGTIYAAGPECKQVKAGDLVFIGAYAGAEINLNDKKYLICKESDLLLILP